VTGTRDLNEFHREVRFSSLGQAINSILATDGCYVGLKTIRWPRRSTTSDGCWNLTRITSPV